METEQRQSYTGLIPEDRVMEIDNRMFCPNVALDMNIYLESGHYYTLYIPKGTVMDKGKLGHIYNSYKPVYLFILKEDKPVFDNYVIMNLAAKLNNSGFNVEEKMEHLHYVGQKIVEDIFSNPESMVYMGYANMLVPLMLDFLEEYPGKCWELVRKYKSKNYLWSHMVNVSFLLMSFARFTGIRERKKLVDIGVGGLLHDIGKSAFPEKLLFKEKPYLEGELEELKLHPRIGVEMVRDSGIVSDTGLLIIGQHHEFYDGSGYPSGLKGTLMSRYSAMAVIVEYFEGMTSRRPNRAPDSSLNVLRWMYSNKEHFDQKLLRKFIDMSGMESSIYTDTEMATGQTSFEDD